MPLPLSQSHEFHYLFCRCASVRSNSPSNLFLSPLAGYTNLPFRLVVREIGGVGALHHGFGQCPLADRKKRQGIQAHRNAPRRFAAGRPTFRLRAGRNARRRAHFEARGAASVDINMGCPVKKVVKIGGGSAMMTELDKTAALVKGMVERRENSRHRQNAPRLGRRKSDRAGSGPRAGRRRRRRDFCSWPHARTGFWRHGESCRHPQSRRSGQRHSRHRQRRHRDAAGREKNAG